MLRVLLDTNLFVRYLLSPTSDSSPVLSVEAALNRLFVLLLPAEVVDELVRRIATKPDLRRRIAPNDIDELVQSLGVVAEALPRLVGPLAATGRDRNDDFLIAQAIAGRADVLVAGDKDLLVLDRGDGVQIVNPVKFLDLFRAT